MKELCITRQENRQLIKELLTGAEKSPLMMNLPLAHRKKLFCQTILQCVDGDKIDVVPPAPLYRGVVIKANESILSDKKRLDEIIREYATGSYSMDLSIAEAYSKCGEDGNLDVMSDTYLSVILRFEDGNYLNICDMYDPDDIVECHFIREREYYCFPTKYSVVSLDFYHSGSL